NTDHGSEPSEELEKMAQNKHNNDAKAITPTLLNDDESPNANTIKRKDTKAPIPLNDDVTILKHQYH
ncbi:22065_t:CDS:2, partial [Gigaspora rosea]